MIAKAKRAAWFVGSIFAIVEMIILGLGGSDFYKQYSILHWPTVDAVVTKCEFSSTERYSGRHNTLSVTYWLKLEFRYAVNGRDYLAPTSFGDSDRLEIEKKTAIYASGTRHRIHYDPFDLRKIRMEAGYELTVPVICGVATLIIAVVGVF